MRVKALQTYASTQYFKIYYFMHALRKEEEILLFSKQVSSRNRENSFDNFLEVT